MLQLQSLLRSRPPESEIEIELERTWEASKVDMEMVWRWSGPKFENTDVLDSEDNSIWCYLQIYY